ncbi:MAG: trypsin-like peptidase domain-containing protein [Clostridia bacterium]|nr:trypsin-like peptidase domain-containing protein [Clostridia bacterium]
MKKKTVLFTLALCLTVVLALILSGCTAANSADALDAEINDNGELIIKFSDGSEKNLGVVVGADGKDGANGKDGAPGENGKDGEDGKNGKDGKDGEDGEDGRDGSDGEDGTVDISLNINTDDTAVAAAIAKGLRSTVSIESHYKKTVYNIYTGTTVTDYASEGSGVIYKLDDEAGNAYIITNHHVVYDAECNTADKISDNIKVYLYGSEYAEQSFPATYVGGSMNYDIAVLYVEGCDALRDEFPSSCTLADSDTVSVGETSIAIGNAEGLCISATSGIISVDSEDIAMNLADGTGQVSRRVIRIDTSVNHGNSGGPLFNDRGEVIGIVSAKLEDDTVDNIGYAIPSNVARAVADNIIDNCVGTELKTVQRVMMGISIIPTDSKAAFNTETGKIEISESTKILTVNEGSAAEGLLFADDIILSAMLNGKTKPITRNHHLIDISLDLRVGDTLTLVVLRGGIEVTVDITFDAGDVTNYK